MTSRDHQIVVYRYIFVYIMRLNEVDSLAEPNTCNTENPARRPLFSIHAVFSSTSPIEICGQILLSLKVQFTNSPVLFFFLIVNLLAFLFKLKFSN